MKPTVVNDRYRLVELIGAGGMATVYRGEDLLLERPVAVKFLREPYASDPEARERFLHEARAAARLDHPNIVHIYDVGQDQGDHPYIVMEMVEGEDLKALIRRDAPLPVTQALALARQICAGVGQAHRGSIVHCDLKPQNILVTENGQVKVADFGIARAVHQDEVENEPAEVVWGSPHYLSPEQARGQTPTPASDVYSIGVMLYEMLTGVPPFHDPDPTVLAMKHLREEPAPLTALNPRVPPGLDWLVRKVLAKEPSGRYRNADQLAIALDEYTRRGQNGTGPLSPVIEETPAVPTRRAPMPDSEIPEPDAAESTQPVATGGELPDYTLWALFGVAAIAVVGLIPLWLFVYRAYTAPVTPPPFATATTPVTTPGTEQLVTVPNVQGLSAADAQRMAESLGLQFEVLGEEESTDARPGAVLNQTPTPGTRVAHDTTVSVILAAGRVLSLPDVVGYDVGSVQPGLEADGLLLAIVEIRGQESEGTIVGQEPPGGTEVRVGDTITLTVSAGADLPIALGVNLNNQVVLEQAWVSQFTYRPGSSVPVTLRWRCTAPLGRQYKVFIHVLTQDLGTLIAQRDIVPVNGLRPTDSWVPGDVINDPHQVTLPESTPPGTYQIRVGLYDDGGRLPVVDSGGVQVIDDTIFVTSVTVE